MKKNFNAKSIIEASSAVVKANFGRVEAILLISLFMSALFLLTEQLITSLVDKYNATMSLPFLTDQSLYSGLIALVLAVFFALIVIPLNIGIKKWYFTQACRSGEEYVGIIFGYYKTNTNYVNSLLFELNRLGRLALCFVPAFAPSAILFAISTRITDDGLVLSDVRHADAIGLLGILMLVAGLIIYIVISLRFFLAGYFFVSDKSMSIEDCFKKSVKYMKGKKSYVVDVVMQNRKLYFSSVLLIPLVYCIPMHHMSLANCARTIITQNEEK